MPQTPVSSRPDVFIAGAGPVGLTMAAALQAQGLRCRIIDKAPRPTDKSKALVVWSRTLELLNGLGLAETFLAAGMKVDGASIYGNGKRYVHLEIDNIASRFNFPLMIPQSETERLLSEHLAAQGIVVDREVELISFTAGDREVTGELRHADGTTEMFSTPWLIGCDGAHSAVRHGLGLEFEGVAEPDDWMLADVHLSGPIAENEISIYWHEKGLLVFFPITPGRFRMVADLGPSAASARPADPTLEEVQAMIDERGPTGIMATHPVWLAGFRINERKVRDYRVGRVMLAGDAAHIHSPAGGQGMNTGMQDAFNLAWKLALVQRGLADENVLLGSYSEERSAIGDQVLNAASRVTTMATLRNPVAQFVRNHIAGIVGSFGFVQDKIKNALCELAINYRGATLSREDWHTGEIIHRGAGIPTGDRLPDARIVCATTGEDISLHNALHAVKHHLLLLPGSEGADGIANLATIARQVRAAYPQVIAPLFVLPVEEGQGAALEATGGIKACLDIDAAIHAAHHAHHATLIVVRPDGYIGYRAQPATADGVLAYLGSYLLGKQSCCQGEGARDANCGEKTPVVTN
ncbi:MAG: FAD-dependent monooxygenase [Pirellulales bacterium]|nr:FAD-dependent monooxygenase [Pirellulales bacterium]